MLVALPYACISRVVVTPPSTTRTGGAGAGDAAAAATAAALPSPPGGAGGPGGIAGEELVITAEGQLRIELVTEDLVHVVPPEAAAFPATSTSAVSAVLFVGEWGYPLCGQPILCIAVGEYLLPDASGSVDAHGSAWLLVVVPELAAALDAALREHANVRQRGEPDPAPEFQSGLSRGIVTAGTHLATGITFAAGVLGTGIKFGGSLLKRAVKPHAEPVVVDKRVKTVVSGLSAATAATASATGTVLSGVTAVASSVGQWVAGEVRRRGLLPSPTESPGRTVAHDIACASLVAASAVFEGLENAALSLCKDTASTAQDFIHHRYGADAGSVATGASEALVGATRTAVNLRRVGMRPFVAATAKAAIKDHIEVSTKK